MARSIITREARQISFDEVCDTLDAALSGPFRRQVVDALASSPTIGDALERLREAMRADVWNFGDASLTLARAVRAYDRATRDEGFHALHDWDGIAAHVNPDTIPVDVLSYVIDQRGADDFDPRVPAILIDYYFMHVLSLLSLRVWDQGDADVNTDRVDALLALLQGPAGSGQRFCDDAATLLLIATAHYEKEEWGYDLLLGRVRDLARRHRAVIALGHGAAMGCHLRFGFQATYGRDTSLMRNDNVADYPWLCFALATLMDEYHAIETGDTSVLDRTAIVESMLNGLSADVRAFLGAGPGSLKAHEVERARFRDQYFAHRDGLEAAFDPFQPVLDRYSALSFFFNFSHNVIKGQVVDSLLWGHPWAVGLNDLFTGLPRPDEPADRSREALARTLMAYARTNPHKIRGRLMPVIVYDAEAGYRAYRLTRRRLAESVP
ncbi:MAG: hypothetical protein IT178_10370 [Acidobacteria bacterium]|nr:hypothetical protein [Acidobacteriota bacterium]